MERGLQLGARAAEVADEVERISEPEQWNQRGLAAASPMIVAVAEGGDVRIEARFRNCRFAK